MIKVTPFEYAQFASLAYNDFNSVKESKKNIPEGWTALILHKSKNYAPVSGYFGLAFKKDSHIVIAHRGTSVINSFSLTDTKIKETLDVINDYISDLQLWLVKKPQQFNDAQKFTKIIMDKYPDCSISFTGHSLGAVLAQLSAAYYQKSAVVFDSPGTKEIIQKTMQHKPEEIIIFNSYPNIINTINTHYNQPFLLKNILICPQRSNIKEFLLLTTKFHSMENILQQFNTSENLSTYTTKLTSWPVNINEAYRFFISYDHNKILWDHCLLENWKNNPILMQQFSKFDDYKTSYISKKLYSENSDTLAVTAKFIKELKLIMDNKLDPENSQLIKLFTEENTEYSNAFSYESIKKSVKHFFINAITHLGNNLLYKHINNIYDKYTEDFEDQPSKHLSGDAQEEYLNDL